MLFRPICCAALFALLWATAHADDGPSLADAPVATWQTPVQIAPMPDAANGDQMMMAMVPGTGFVKGTSAALQSIGQPLPTVPGRNRTLDACRALVKSQASKAGAQDIEAASAGGDKIDRKGDTFAPVLFRITYAQPTMYEVRQATMICVVDRRGGMVDAYIPAEGEITSVWMALRRRR